MFTFVVEAEMNMIDFITSESFIAILTNQSCKERMYVIFMLFIFIHEA